MIHVNYNYVELVIGGAHNRGNIVTVDRATAPLDAADCFTTMFRFTEDLKAHVERTGSMKGVRLPCWSDFLWFDIDAKTLDLAAAGLNRLLTELRHVDTALPGAASVFFSGKKGFHVGVPTACFGGGLKPRADFPNVMRTLARKIAFGVDIDDIYNHVRLWRLPGSLHSETWLRKTLLTPDIILG